MSSAIPAKRIGMSGVERLCLRVSEMINHPIAQAQRWVKIHRLDTDGDREWDEVIGVLSSTDELDVAFSDDGSVTVSWQQPGEESQVEAVDELEEGGMLF